MQRTEIFVLGPFRARLDGNAVAGLTAPRLQGLLAYLALEEAGARPREQLAALLWPERPEARAAHSLRQGVYTLNKLLTVPGLPEPLVATRQTVALNRDSALWVDVLALLETMAVTAAHDHQVLERCDRCCARLERALALYRGPLLEGVLVESEPFEAWLRLERQRLERQVLAAFGSLADHYAGREQWRRVQEVAFRQVELAPWHERGHRQLMRALAAQGRRTEALAHYQRLVLLLGEMLDVAPAQPTLALVAAIRSGSLVADGQAGPTLRLPRQHTPFVGRKGELRAIAAHSDHVGGRLLTLVGPGGAGKSRLAIEAAQRLADGFAGGVVFVPLAAAGPAHLVTAVLAALEIPPAERQEEGMAERLLAALRQRQLLLILDNYEQLLPETGLLRRILAEAPGVRLLVTSRQRLGLPAERVLEVAGLPYPAAGAGEQGQAFDAVTLFLELAQRRQPGTGLSPAVAALCRLVGGMPLALELAAALVRELPLAEIVAAVSRNLDILTTEMPDVDPRHRSLRAVFDHSWSMLDEAEKDAMRRIAVFQGGFTAEAAARVAEATANSLEALADKSLLQVGDDRYCLHAVLQQYAAERLESRPALAMATRDRHADCFLGLLAEMTAAEARVTVAAELDNVRAAWEWSVARGHTEALALALPGLARFYVQAGYLEEGHTLLGETAARLPKNGSPVATRLQVRLKAEQLYFVYSLARYEETLATAREAQRLGRAAGDEEAVARGHLYTGMVLARQGAYAEAGEAIDTARLLAEAAGLWRLVADCLRAAGQIAVRLGDYASAERAYGDCLALARREGYVRGEAYALSGLGNTALVQEEPLTARARYEAALSLFAAAGDEVGATTCRDNLATSYWAVGDYRQAALIYEENLALRRRIGDRRGEGASLLRLAMQSHYGGELEAGRERYRQALSLFREIGYRRGEGEVLAHLCLLRHQEGAQDEAIALGRAAERIARANHDRSDLGYSLNFVGHALAAAGEGAAARAAYEEALALRRQLGEWNRTMEPLAGLAELALAGGDDAEALAYGEQMVAHLETGSLEVVDEPARVYLAAFRVLRAAGDPRSERLRRAGVALLRARAALLGDDGARFLALPLHRALLQLEPAGP